jgi:hypothetical protein
MVPVGSPRKSVAKRLIFVGVGSTENGKFNTWWGSILEAVLVLEILTLSEVVKDLRTAEALFLQPSSTLHGGSRYFAPHTK